MAEGDRLAPTHQTAGPPEPLRARLSGADDRMRLDHWMDRALSVSKRTAQRMLRALEAQFPDTSTSTDSDGRKRWHLPSGALRDLMSLSPEELAALDIAAETLKRSGLSIEADDLLAASMAQISRCSAGFPRAPPSSSEA
jgi:predicted DNA-binding transcriptional regulator YafY